MTHTAHTPGPLALHGKMISDTVETVGGMFCIRPIKHTVSVTGRPIIDYSAPAIAYAYSAQDAKLFAAAPDLLAMLRELTQHFTFDPEGELTGKEFRNLYARAKAALDKAEGRA